MAVAWGMSLVCAKYRDRPQQHLCHYTCATTTATSTLLPSLQYGLAALLIVQLVPGSFQWNRWMIWVLVFYTELVFSTRHYHCIVCNLFIFSSAGFERPLFLSFFLIFFFLFGTAKDLICYAGHFVDEGFLLKVTWWWSPQGTWLLTRSAFGGHAWCRHVFPTDKSCAVRHFGMEIHSSFPSCSGGKKQHLWVLAVKLYLIAFFIFFFFTSFYSVK